MDVGSRGRWCRHGGVLGEAALDLESATMVTSTGTSGYLTAVNELEQLTSMPDAMLTTAQMEEEQSLTRRLNAFFDTKGEHGGGATSPTSTMPSPSKQLTISVQSDSQMEAAGNNGPSSSILVPTSCESSGTTITANGTYQGGFAGNGYNRYGDIVELYVFGAPSSGYPQGPQLAASSAKDSPPIGGYGSWRVSASIDPGSIPPARCVVAAQPTHDVQLAP